MSCPNCDQAQLNDDYGVYNRQCIHCCARLVRSARPSRRHQESLLAVIERDHEGPTREEILEELRRI